MNTIRLGEHTTLNVADLFRESIESDRYTFVTIYRAMHFAAINHLFANDSDDAVREHLNFRFKELAIAIDDALFPIDESGLPPEKRRTPII